MECNGVRLNWNWNRERPVWGVIDLRFCVCEVGRGVCIVSYDTYTEHVFFLFLFVEVFNLYLRVILVCLILCFSFLFYFILFSRIVYTTFTITWFFFLFYLLKFNVYCYTRSIYVSFHFMSFRVIFFCACVVLDRLNRVPTSRRTRTSRTCSSSRPSRRTASA